MIASCEDHDVQKERSSEVSSHSTLFSLLPAGETGLQFANTLTEGPNTNILVYEYFYNGGGVATADFNGDGLTDLYFTANMADNALYLNRGNLTFEDVTAASGAGGRPGPWKTGVSVVDLNADGRPDIYLSYSGMLPPDKRRNQLFINEGSDGQGVPTFSERAAAYGLDSPAFTNQAYFFDYDGDGDLDALLLNHNPKSLPILNVAKTEQLLARPDPERGLRLYRNDDRKFIDVTERAGINGSALSYGLSIALEDYNQDGMPDIYVSNDYEVPDYLYINRGNGTFANELAERLGQSSHFSMGSDAADINNDGRVDLLTLDMLPADNRRRKLLMADDNRSRHALNAASGFPAQTMRNMLHLSRGDGTFAEVGQLQGVATTDWSWSALLADLDNDGWKDLYVTNGYLRDYTNQDFIKYMNDYVAKKGRLQRSDVLELLHQMPSSEVSNLAFQNQGGTAYRPVTAVWGLERPSNSNGAVAVDLDNDGDLDLVVNTIDSPALLYQNNTAGTDYLQVAFHGPPANPSGIGAKVILESTDNQQVRSLYPNRGYLSTGPTQLHYGLGAGGGAQVHSLQVIWPDGRQQTLADIPCNQRITLEYGDATEAAVVPQVADLAFLQEVKPPLSYYHRAAMTDDLDRQALLPRQLSASGPVAIAADLTGSGRQDYLVGGDTGSPTRYYAQRSDGGFAPPVSLAADNGSVVTDLAVFDADSDGDLDVYAAHGGYHRFTADDPTFQDVLYLNDGRGRFTVAPGLLPELVSPTATVAVTGVAEGRQLLFVGGGAVPGSYPLAAPSYILERQSDGSFTELPLPDDWLGPGLVKDAAWEDLDGDGQPELITVGEWMPITVYRIGKKSAEELTSAYFPADYSGWWNTLQLADLNGDGRRDLIVGNQGQNNLLQASLQTPVELFATDIDGNGSVDPLLFNYTDGTSYPDATRDELLGQLSGLRRTYTNYAGYADATRDELLAQLNITAEPLRATTLSTTVFLRSATGGFEPVTLPVQAQYAPVHAIAVLDANRDGVADLLLTGNDTRTKLRTGPNTANAGTLLLGNGHGNFTYAGPEQSGLHLKGDVRSVVPIGNDLLLFGRYGKPLLSYKMRRDAL